MKGCVPFASLPLANIYFENAIKALITPMINQAYDSGTIRKLYCTRVKLLLLSGSFGLICLVSETFMNSVIYP